MDCERKINLSEGVPLNSEGAANIILNAGKNTKVNSPNGTVIHLKTESAPHDVGLHINTTFSIASSKKVKILFILSFLLSLMCIVISCSVAFYYWNEMTFMRKQLDIIKDQLIIQNFKESGLHSLQDNGQQPFVAAENPAARMRVAERMGKQADVGFSQINAKDDITASARRYYVEDLGEEPIVLVDSSKKYSNKDTPDYDQNFSPFQRKDLLVAHFVGAEPELNLGRQSTIGPWVADDIVSSKDSSDKVQMSSDYTYVTIKEEGLYMVYAQIVYLTHSPTTYFIWARKRPEKPRMLSTCSTGDDSTNRPLKEAQISCSVQTITRLHKGDIVNLSQREKNMTLWLKPGYSYFGLLKLSS